MKYTKYRFTIEGKFESGSDPPISEISYGLDLQVRGYKQYSRDSPRITRIDVEKIGEGEK